MSVNKVDYDVLQQAVTTYSNQANAIDDVINALTAMNGELQGGWTNKTSDAFIARFQSDYKVKLQNIRDAVQEISTYISQYSSNRLADDEASAASIGG